jgi:spermidine synthase
MQRLWIVLCLVFSGFTALVYQLIWTRLLGFSFGTSTEAVSTVLAVFFAGLAIGNLVAARLQPRIERPLRVYAILEMAVGVAALISLPLLENLHAVYAWLGVPGSASGLTLSRVVLSALVLLPPTIAMGATLPVVARGLIDRDAARGRGSAILYAANTLGAVLGAHLCGFWLIPELGLTRSVLAAGVVNLAVAGFIWRFAGDLRAAPLPQEGIQSGGPPKGARPFLIFFGVSGFVAIGYEIVWSKVFGIVMEGTLYGFAAVLSGYLAGIALGSFAMARFVDRIRDLPRAFALLHVAIGVSVVAGLAVVPWLPWAHRRFEAWTGSGDAIHSLYLLVLPIVLLPTALFGAAFPVLVRLYTRRASAVGHGMGIASAVNTAGSILASFIVGFWWIPSLGTDATIYILLLLDFAVALVILALLQESHGRARFGAMLGSTLMIGTVALSFGGIHVDDAIAGRQLPPLDAASYVKGLRDAKSTRAFKHEGKTSIVTVRSATNARLLRTNGLPEAGFNYAPPHYPSETVLLGVFPWLLAEEPEDALIVGLGGGNTVRTLLQVGVPSIEVVELEEGVVEAVSVLHRGRQNPVEDPRVSLRIADGRNHLLMGQLSGGRRYDLIASQPSHPWRIGAANLFTEDFFEVARDALAERGIFATWLNGFRMEEESLLAVVTSFERIFPGSLLIDISTFERGAFLLVGSRQPIRLDVSRLRERLASAGAQSALAPFELLEVESLLALLEGPSEIFAALSPDLANTDDNALVETRVPRIANWETLDFAGIEARLDPRASVLPPLEGEIDIPALVETLLARRSDAALIPKARRLLANWPDETPRFELELLEARFDLRSPTRVPDAMARLAYLARTHPTRPEPLRALARTLAQRGEGTAAVNLFAQAYARSGAARDACDAGRADPHANLTQSASWFDRIPAEARPECPALPLHMGWRALEAGTKRSDLEAAFTALAAHLRSGEGAGTPRGHEVAARLAWALGDVPSARAHSDMDARARQDAAAPLLERAEAAFAKGDTASAREDLDHATFLTPSNGRALELQAKLALRAGAPADQQQAFARMRRWSDSPELGIGLENRLRSVHGLPLVAEAPLELER